MRSFTEWYEDTIYRFQARRRWRHVTGYQDMCRINAERLTVERDRYLGQYGEAAPLVQMLTAQILLNRCGVFTYLAQPGLAGYPIEHRAILCTIASDEKKDWLEAELWQRGHLQHSRTPIGDPAGQYAQAILELHDPEDRTKYGPVGPGAVHGIPITRSVPTSRPTATGPNGEQLTAAEDVIAMAGQQLTAAEIHQMFPVAPDAAAQLYRGWQYTLYARAFGDSNLFIDLIDICQAELDTRETLATAAAE